jgi:hypothetical protein
MFFFAVFCILHSRKPSLTKTNHLNVLFGEQGTSDNISDTGSR